MPLLKPVVLRQNIGGTSQVIVYMILVTQVSYSAACHTVSVCWVGTRKWTIAGLSYFVTIYGSRNSLRRIIVHACMIPQGTGLYAEGKL